MSVSSVTGGTTSNGTPIVDPNDKSDLKNMFMTLLAAQLQNQDPTQPQDSTAYVSQLATFTSMEQMADLNTTMTLNSAQDLIGKTVELKYDDGTGNFITGKVTSVFNQNGNISFTLDSFPNGNFSMSDILYVHDMGDLEGAAHLVGKYVNTNVLMDSEGTDYIKGRVVSVANGFDGVIYAIVEYTDKDGKTKKATIPINAIATVDEAEDTHDDDDDEITGPGLAKKDSVVVNKESEGSSTELIYGDSIDITFNEALSDESVKDIINRLELAFDDKVEVTTEDNKTFKITIKNGEKVDLSKDMEITLPKGSVTAEEDDENPEEDIKITIPALESKSSKSMLSEEFSAQLLNAMGNFSKSPYSTMFGKR